MSDHGHKEIRVLDHGYVKLVEKWGSEESIIEAARMSTGKGFNGWGGQPCPECEKAGRLSPNDRLFKTYDDAMRARDVNCPCKGTGKFIGDEGLLSFLYQNEHATPFEMAGVIFEVKSPIFVFREWHRHRTQSFNEMSARYTPLPDENYIPSVERLMINASKTNKQAGTIKGAEEMNEAKAAIFRHDLEQMYQQQEELYQFSLKSGVPKELARIHLPVGRYSRMRASANLRNWLHFLSLRMDSAAQWEIRQYAEAVGKMIEEQFPRTFKLFTEKMRQKRSYA